MRTADTYRASRRNRCRPNLSLWPEVGAWHAANSRAKITVRRAACVQAVYEVLTAPKTEPADATLRRFWSTLDRKKYPLSQRLIGRMLKQLDAQPARAY